MRRPISIRILAILQLGLMLSGTSAATGIHRWRDENGDVHFSDHVPPGMASETVTVRPNVYATPSLEKLAAALAVHDGVVLYSTEWCTFCRAARRYFRAHGIPFEEYDVETTEKGRRDYARLGARGVPVILVGDQRLNGFSPAAFERVWRER